jgi:hypothetical protein
MLHYLRIGLSVMHLRHCYSRAERKTAREINDLLYQLIHTKDIPAVRERIASMICLSLPAPDEQSRQVVDRLVDLHCALRSSKKEQENAE